jgi:sugar phosphate isomerase/epimerase
VRVGIDSYSYHRLLGELRAGELPSAVRWSDGVADVACEAVALGVRAVSLQTCFIGAPDRLAADALARVQNRLEVVLAWGAPRGLRYGQDAAALEDLRAWLELAGGVGIELVRIVLGGPAERGAAAQHSEAAGAALEHATRAARERGIHLAVENHGDITASALRRILDGLDPRDVGVCFDTANALRVGDDVVAAAALLAPRVTIVHLKDIEDPVRECDPVAGPCSVRYGTGVVPLAETLAQLRRGGFDGLVCVEVGQVARGDDERELVRSGLAWLAAAGVCARR